MYYMLDAVLKGTGQMYAPHFEQSLPQIFVQDLVTSFWKGNLQLTKKLLMLFLTWEGLFSPSFMEFVINSFYKQCKDY